MRSDEWRVWRGVEGVERSGGSKGAEEEDVWGSKGVDEEKRKRNRRRREDECRKSRRGEEIEAESSVRIGDLWYVVAKGTE